MKDATILFQRLTIDAAEQRIDSLIESRDSALDLVAELRAENERLRAALETIRGYTQMTFSDPQTFRAWVQVEAADALGACLERSHVE